MLLSAITEPPRRDRWAQLRFAITGPLLAALLPPRAMHEAYAAAQLAVKDDDVKIRLLVEALKPVVSG